MWSYKDIRSNAFETTFKRGFKAWLVLVAVCFIFVFLGSTDSEQLAIFNEFDRLWGTELLQDNMKVIDTYIAEDLSQKYEFFASGYFKTLVNLLSQRYSWLVNLLAANFAYFQRNSGEVIVLLFVSGLVLGIFKLFVRNVFDIGKCRYAMESRFQESPRIRRIFAPFHKKYLWNEIKVMATYKLVLFLWQLTIVGFFIKEYEYGMVPYLLAENPDISWRDAKKLSSQMTRGYKWKMFLTELSYIYVWILKLVPLVGFCVAYPLEAELRSEIYFTLRERYGDKTYFIETAFDREPYVLSGESVEEFILEDTVLSADELKGDVVAKVETLGGGYRLTDYIMFFFSFSIVGWIWEVFLFVVEDHILCNRGTLYGPWLPIYGVGGVVMIYLLSRFKNHSIKLFSLSMLICSALEYLTSWLLDYFNNASYWDYTGRFINLNGRICLTGMVMFGLAGLFGVYIAAPHISAALERFGRKKTIALCTVLSALFVADLVCVIIFGFNSGEGVGMTLS